MNVFLSSVVLAPADEGGSNGSGSRRRGARGRGGPSIVARRRPGRAKAEQAAAESDAQPADEQKPKPRTRRGGSSRRSPSRATAAKSEEAVAQGEDQPAEEQKPATRRRRAASSGRSPSRATATAAEVEETTDAVEEPEAAPAEDEEPEKPATRRRTRVAAAKTEAPSTIVSAGDNGLAQEIAALRTVMEEQRGMMAEIRAGLLSLGKQIDYAGPRPRLGVFVDVPNVLYGVAADEEPINMGKLLDMIREGRELVRATAYSPVSDDPREPVEQQKFVAPFVPYEYRIVTKPLKRFADGSIKGNFDVEMAIDMVTMADRLDVIAFVSGDADFARAVETVQARGVRVEVVAFGGSTSLEMRALADGYLELGSVIDQLR